MEENEFKEAIVKFIESNISPVATKEIDFGLRFVSRRINNKSRENVAYAVDILGISEGNPGALTVLTGVLNEYPVQFEDVAAFLVVNRVFGSNIWVLYKNLCDEDLSQFIRTCTSEVNSDRRHTRVSDQTGTGFGGFGSN